jgi:hypothetical protein
MVKNLTGRKLNVLQDELKITGGGIYAFYPYETLDKYKKGVFKIGMALDFNHRIDQYHTYFQSFYMVAFLQNPTEKVKTRSQTKTKVITKKMLYLQVEKHVQQYMDKNGGKRIFSSTRVKNPNEQGLGTTEWVYCNEDLIHEAFIDAQKKYGGILHMFYLEGIDPDTGKITNINQDFKEQSKHTPNFMGKVIYRL